MKLHKYGQRGLVKYYGQNKAVEIPPFSFNEQYVRGVWVSNVANIDTPIMKDIESYKEYLVKMIENIASYNINLMVFQVRPLSDAYYKSKLNPWSRYITGTEGKDPGFDVLKFVIEEAKKYGIEVHAWMNPYRVSQRSLDDLKMTKEEYLNTLDDLNFAKRNPNDTILDGQNKIILKPSSSIVNEFIKETVKEIITNYDVTGVHIDDYFYPYAKVPYEQEEQDYLEKKGNTDLTLDDFRRQNVDKMIEEIHQVIKECEKDMRKVLFGISPFGIYRNHQSIDPNGWEYGSLQSPHVCQCYSDLYSDVYKWMEEGWIDYVVPQVYFPFERKDVNYHDLTKWWVETAKRTNTILYIGQGLYQMGVNNMWRNPLEIDYQLRFNQQFANISGTVFFTYKDLVPGQNMVKDAAIALLKARWNTNKYLETIKK